MKEKWIEDLREGLSDFEMDAPEGLWESLGVEPSAPISSWRRKAAVAAALLALLSIGGIFLLWISRGESLEVSDTGIAAYTSVSENVLDEPVHSFPTTTEQAQSSTTTKIQKITDILNVGDEEEELVSSTSGNECIASYIDTVSQEGQNTAVETDIKDYKQNDTGKGKPQYAGIAPKRRSYENHNGRYAVAAYTSGIGQATESMGERSSTNISNSFGDPNFESPNTPPLYGDPDEVPISTESHHHKPIKAGITFLYGLTDRVSLETGVMYTSLSSDFTVSQGNKVSSGERQLHYIGIPLNVKLSVWSWKAVDLYLSAGVMGEKCVSNRFQTKSASEGISLEQYSSQKEKPMQWSVNAAPGLQLKPLPNIGIFAEPGVSYYFNDGTNLSTIYKERPWNFNLNVGVRLILNPGK
ncbi:MAG: PorT family protein [Muribaculaceae bacterium]|nr:PorT family protein [Muribaculaceae bacterium]